jgi:KDO2-lipid IV(A) lauroyltransferase
MWLAAHLPYPLQIHIGRGLGLLSYYFARSRRHICEVNLRLCFPELTEQEHKKLVRKTFRSNGIGLIEVAIAWFRDPEDYRSRTTVTGLENLEAAIAEGKGVLLLCAHFSSLEMGGFLFNLVGDMDVTYRPNKNLLFQAAMFNGRIRHFRHVYDRKDVRGAMRSLKAARILWYAPDQDYGAKHSVFVPFFGVQAATITATARFAKVNDSAVVFYSHYRNEDNDLVEQAIRKQPDQYLWLHKRFKTQAAGPSARPY